MASRNSVNRAPILKLAVPSPLRRTFDYLPPEDSNSSDWATLQPGMRLLVPFGTREVTALLTEISDSTVLKQDQLRHAVKVLDQTPLFSTALMKCFNWAVSYYQHPPGDVYNTLLPVKLRQVASAELTPAPVWEKVRDLLDQDLEHLRRAPKQLALLQFINERGVVDYEHCRAAGFSPSLLLQLENKLLIRKVIRNGSAVDHLAQREALNNPARIKPNQDQTSAINTILKSLHQYQCHLLDGITGSGKTEVYIQVIAEVLRLGRQALVLVPEIGLTPQTIRTFTERFNCPIVAMHSGMSNSERLDAWLQAKSGLARIIIGTRSAIFTPMAQPGIIIIDEEHDSSFKQQDGFKYSARDLAVVRAREENINIVLGSATPALETLHNAMTGRYSHLRLKERAGGASKSAIRLLDSPLSGSDEGISPELNALIKAHLENGNQVLIFINRRGFAPALFCKDCGFVFECNRCDAQLTVHKTPVALHCHHCESRSPIPRSCPNCNGKQLTTRGMGTEKTEQYLQLRFSPYPVIRIDRDSTRRKNSLDDLLNQVQTGEPCILVGTQMLAKGHHFPKVTLVAVLDADSGLFSPDFRGQETMIQLLFQVAGRAGRAEMPGQVMVQTRHASHASLQLLLQNDYHRIAQLLTDERKLTSMPPFGHLALFRAEAGDPRLPIQFLAQLYELCLKQMDTLSLSGVVLYRPVPAPMEKRAGKYRAQLLLQAQSRSALQVLLSSACPVIESLKLTRKVRWSIDVDPLEMI